MQDISMFQYLADESPSKKVDLELLGEFAKSAAASYIGSQKIPMNDTIIKIAKSENLNPDEIHIVCQEANKCVNGELFKVAEDKYTQFDLADSKVVLALMSNETIKTASAVSDYDFAPRENSSPDFAFTKTAGHDGLKVPEHMKKIAHRERLIYDAQKISDAYIANNSAIQTIEREFCKIARNMLMPFRIDERAEQLPIISKFCKMAGVSPEHTSRLIDQLGVVMVRQGLLEKTADLKVDDSLISEDLNCRVINGTHPLYIVLNTLPEKDEKKKLYEERYNIIQEQLQACGADGAIRGHNLKEL